MGNEDDTFRRLRRIPYNDLQAKIHTGDSDEWDAIHGHGDDVFVAFLLSHGWTAEEYISMA